MKLKEIRLLRKSEQQKIIGGNVLTHADDERASCSAKCLPHNGAEYTVTCEGNSCTASDYEGCTADGKSKPCRT